MKVREIPGYEQCLTELGTECNSGEGESRFQFYGVRLLIKHPDGQVMPTRQIPVRACCASSATEIGWERIGYAVTSSVDGEIALKGVCVHHIGPAPEPEQA